MKRSKTSTVKAKKRKTPPIKKKQSKTPTVKMEQSKTLPVNLIAMRADKYAPDGKSLIISMTTKYSAERTYSVPVECLYELIADLQKLKRPTAAVPIEAPSQPAPAAVDTVPTAAADLNQVNVIVPKKWMLRSGLPNHPLIVMIFDPQTKTQAGYALTVTAAREMSNGLVKYADAVASHEASKPRLS
jgi:hypothetical protein